MQNLLLLPVNTSVGMTIKIIEFSDSQSLLHIIFYRSANLEIAELIILFLSIVDISDWLSYRAETCVFCKLSIVHHR